MDKIYLQPHLASSYVVDMFTKYTAERALTSSHNSLLTVPRISYNGPVVWNSLPDELHSAITVSSFKSRLNPVFVSQALIRV